MYCFCFMDGTWRIAFKTNSPERHRYLDIIRNADAKRTFDFAYPTERQANAGIRLIRAMITPPTPDQERREAERRSWLGPDIQ